MNNLLTTRRLRISIFVIVFALFYLIGSRNGGRRMANINLVHAMSIIGLLTVMFYVQH